MHNVTNILFVAAIILTVVSHGFSKRWLRISLNLTGVVLLIAVGLFAVGRSVIVRTQEQLLRQADMQSYRTIIMHIEQLIDDGSPEDVKRLTRNYLDAVDEDNVKRGALQNIADEITARERSSTRAGDP